MAVPKAISESFRDDDDHLGCESITVGLTDQRDRTIGLDVGQGGEGRLILTESLESYCDGMSITNAAGELRLLAGVFAITRSPVLMSESDAFFIPGTTTSATGAALTLICSDNPQTERAAVDRGDDSAGEAELDGVVCPFPSSISLPCLPSSCNIASRGQAAIRAV